MKRINCVVIFVCIAFFLSVPAVGASGWSGDLKYAPNDSTGAEKNIDGETPRPLGVAEEIVQGHELTAPASFVNETFQVAALTVRKAADGEAGARGKTSVAQNSRLQSNGSAKTGDAWKPEAWMVVLLAATTVLLHLMQALKLLRRGGKPAKGAMIK